MRDGEQNATQQLLCVLRNFPSWHASNSTCHSPVHYSLLYNPEYSYPFSAIRQKRCDRRVALLTVVFSNDLQMLPGCFAIRLHFIQRFRSLLEVHLQNKLLFFTGLITSSSCATGDAFRSRKDIETQGDEGVPYSATLCAD